MSARRARRPRARPLWAHGLVSMGTVGRVPLSCWASIVEFAVSCTDIVRLLRVSRAFRFDPLRKLLRTRYVAEDSRWHANACKEAMYIRLILDVFGLQDTEEERMKWVAHIGWRHRRVPRIGACWRLILARAVDDDGELAANIASRRRIAFGI